MTGGNRTDWVWGVQAQYVAPIWEQVAPLIGRALARNRGEYTVDDIRRMIESRDMQLWVYGAGGKVRAAAVTEILSFPRRTVCNVVLCAGACRAGWRQAAARMEEWAKAQGCAEIKAIGRRGWARAVGWQELDTVTGKAL